MSAAIDILEEDSLTRVLGFLDWKDILKARVCKRWREAARRTSVPQSQVELSLEWHKDGLLVKNRNFAVALGWISEALPLVPSLQFDFGLSATEGFDIADGEDSEPSRRMEGSSPHPPVDLSVIANFVGLKSLYFFYLEFNGRYSFLFDFPRLESLSIVNCGRIKWDLADTVGLPILKKLRVADLGYLTGNLKDLMHLQSTLVDLCVFGCENVNGSIHDVASFPLLEELNVDRTAVVGDIRNIGPNDFPSLRRLEVGEKVYGGGEFTSIVDAEAIMLARYHLKKRNPELFRYRRWRLSSDSPQHYGVHKHHIREPPFLVEFVEAGPRIGWRWTNRFIDSCETNWLDPEVKESEEGYEEYAESMDEIERNVGFYRGFFVPPTEAQHEELCRSIPLRYS